VRCLSPVVTQRPPRTLTASAARDGLISCAAHPTLCSVATWIGKHPLVGALGAALVMLALFVVLPAVMGRKMARRDAALFDAFVAGFGGGARAPGDPARPVGVVSVNGHEARIAVDKRVERSSDSDPTTWTYTRYTMSVEDAGYVLDLRARTAAFTLGSFVTFGEAEFDDNLLVSTNDEARTRRLLDATVRQRVR